MVGLLGIRTTYKLKDLKKRIFLNTLLPNDISSQEQCPNFLVTNQKLTNKDLLEKALSFKYSKKISIITSLGKKIKGF